MSNYFLYANITPLNADKALTINYNKIPLCCLNIIICEDMWSVMLENFNQDTKPISIIKCGAVRTCNTLSIWKFF